MSIAELKQIIKDLPDDMEVVMPYGEESFITVCNEGWEVANLPVVDEEIEYDEDKMEYAPTLILRPCSCHVEDLPVVPQEQILN